MNTVTSLFLVWSAEPMQRLIAMVQLVKGCGHLKGGAMCVAMRTYERHGDPALSKHVRQVRAAAHRARAAASPSRLAPYPRTRTRIPRAGTSDPARGSTNVPHAIDGDEDPSGPIVGPVA